MTGSPQPTDAQAPGPSPTATSELPSPTQTAALTSNALSEAERHSLAGNGLMGQGKYEEAIAEFDESIRLAPRLVKAYNDLGNAYFAIDRLERALDTARGGPGTETVGSWESVSGLPLRHRHYEAP